MKYAYIRVSTVKQDYERQEYAIKGCEVPKKVVKIQGNINYFLLPYRIVFPLWWSKQQARECNLGVVRIVQRAHADAVRRPPKDIAFQVRVLLCQCAEKVG